MEGSNEFILLKTQKLNQKNNKPLKLSLKILFCITLTFFVGLSYFAYTSDEISLKFLKFGAKETAPELKEQLETQSKKFIVGYAETKFRVWTFFLIDPVTKEG